MELWFRRQYQLSPKDPRFLEMTPEEIETEWWAWQMADSGVKVEDEDADFDQEAILAQFEAEAAASDAGGAVADGEDEFEEVINDRH